MLEHVLGLIHYPKRSVGKYPVAPLVYKRGYIDKTAGVDVGRGFWINCSVALHNFPE